MAYPVDVRGVLETLAGTRVVTGEIEIGTVELGDQAYTFTAPVTFEVTFTNTGAGIVAQGSARAVVRTECVRCLCDFDLAYSADVEGFYVFPGKEEGIPEEQEFEFISESLKVDVEPAVRQAMIVDLPFAPVHDADCKGICPTCGADLNDGDCGCARDAAASPFAALADLVAEDAPLAEPGDDGP